MVVRLQPWFLALCLLVKPHDAVAADTEVSAGNDASQRPNVVLIMLDDLGFSDLGCYGASIIQTPSIDQIANEGLRFTQFYNTAKCHSSRICLLTGLYPFQAGNEAMDRGVTIAEVLQPAGYFTAMAGKWHLEGEPTERGFTRYFGHLSGATNFFTGDSTFRLNGEPWNDFTEDFYTTDANTDYAIKFVDEALTERKPFFLYVAYNAPHYPLQAPEEDVRRYLGKFREVGWDNLRETRYRRQIELGVIDPKWALSPRPDSIPAWEDLSPSWQEWEDQRMATFAAMVDRVDQNVKRLVDHLKEQSVWENTLFMLCSDNGACPFERTRHRELPSWDAASYWTYDVGWAHVGNTPFRWFKQNQHEGGIASPLIVHWTAGLKTKPGAVTNQAGHLIDLLPTIAEVAGADYPVEFDGRKVAPLQGRSLQEVFAGKQRAPHPELYFQFGNNRALRRGDWKIVSARSGSWELYNLAEDRTELNDLSGVELDRLADMKAAWYRMAEDVDQAPPRLRQPVKGGTTAFPAKLQSQRELKQAP